jgi:hypothetical protein
MARVEAGARMNVEPDVDLDDAGPSEAMAAAPEEKKEEQSHWKTHARGHEARVKSQREEIGFGGHGVLPQCQDGSPHDLAVRAAPRRFVVRRIRGVPQMR